MLKCNFCFSDKIEKTFKKNGYDFFKCCNCGLVFVWPIPVNLVSIYNEKYFISNDKCQKFGYTNYELDKMPLKDFFIKSLEKLENLITGRRILDIGCANGFFLDLAKIRGWETDGIEISQYAGNIAREKGHNINYKIPDAIDKKYSLITFWDVLEHVDNPSEFIVKANKILDNNGYIIINTIDIGSFWAKLLKSKWHLILPPEHLYYFDRKNLQYVLSKNGFQVEEISKPGKNFSLSYIFQTLYRWQNIVLWKKISEYFDTFFWRKINIPINLKDNIYILAKKTKDV